MDVLQYILLALAMFLGIYIVFRILALAVFKSWFDMKLKNKERGAINGNHGSDGQDGSIGG